MSRWATIAASLLAASFPLLTGAEPAFDAAKAFGARPSVEHLSLSPDGMSVAFVAPTQGQGAVVFVQSLAKGAPRASKPILGASGKPERLGGCNWVSNQRLVCTIFGVIGNSALLEPVEFSRLVAVNTDGSKLQLLSTRSSSFTRGYQLGGGNIVDWLPDEDGAVLMARVYLPDDHTGSHIGSSKRGIAVDRIDTLTLASRTVEQPREDAVDYISDGHGTVRIMGVKSRQGALGDLDSGNITYYYRMAAGRDWLPMGGEVVGEEHNGFDPVAVDHDANLAYGYKKLDGRLALYTVALDGSMKEDLVYARPDVDVGSLIRIGRRNRVVGVSYSDEFSRYHFLEPDFEKMLASLAKALRGQALHVVDSSVDENKLLINAGSDQDPGVYYLFDKKLRQLETFFAVRSELEGVKLAQVKPIHYQAADGTSIPGYLTLPPGVDTPKDLPAIVMPHGGPSARDYWRFDWLAQYYAARGFVVLQPNFRGSKGYGDEFFEQNGFRSWPTAIGDVLDAGRWLVAQGIARADKLAVVGWSYGGYAALQSAVVDPSVFKAVVAIAPVTDLPELKEAHRNWSDFLVVSREIGDGPHVREGSPALNAAKIKVPVMMFQGELDRNVPIRQSREMADRLSAAGVQHELITWPDLDHQLEDSQARAEMLRKSDAFLRRAMSM
jgi:acetyl esterase/lipase